MKLRSKKTGEIVTLKDEGELALLKLVESSLPNGLGLWEEVKEPLIKDEKTRKAVRAWAEAEGVDEVAVMSHLVWGEKLTEIAKISNVKQEITFKGDLGIEMGDYTIAELCGSEE